MPIYEYKCTECNETVTKLQKLTDEPLTFCCECQSHTLKKQIGTPSFNLTGSGWYKDGHH